MLDEPSWQTRQVRGLQYQPLIDYVILAEFDIDTGSTVRHQYPHNIPGYKVDWFAEFMLPEGAHNRDIDYTYIFLNRDSPHIDQHLWENQIKFARTTAKSDDKRFLFGINLVKTKHDSSVRRGAIVKAMCIFSQYHFIESFKRPLEIALEKYFENPSLDVLKSFYHSFNSVNLARVPKPSWLEQRLMLRGVNNETVVDTSILKDHTPPNWHAEVQYTFGEDIIPVRIPLYRTEDEVGDIYVTLLVKTFGEQVMRIYHAILMKQRVLFVGYNHAASEVAQMVLSAVAMVAPPMENIIRRTYPYSNLSDLSFLEVPGYVAGVTNPMFQQRDTWWDLLCVLDLPNGTGTITAAEDRVKGGSSSSSNSNNNSTKNNNLSSNSSSGSSNSSGGMSSNNSRLQLPVTPYEEQPHYSSDLRLVTGILSGIQALLGEEWVRQQFRDYTVSILQHALDQDQGLALDTHKIGDKVNKFLVANAARIRALRVSPEFADMPPYPWVHCSSTTNTINNDDNNTSDNNIKDDSNHTLRNDTAADDEPVVPNNNSSIDIITTAVAAATDANSIHTCSTAADWQLMRFYVRKLQQESGQRNVAEVQTYYEHLSLHLCSENTIQGLLVMLPESQGGLACIASGLFHKNPIVRLCTVQLLLQVQAYTSTKLAYHALCGFYRAAFDRQNSKLLSGALNNEVLEFKAKLSISQQQQHLHRQHAVRKIEGVNSSNNTIYNSNTVIDNGTAVVSEQPTHSKGSVGSGTDIDSCVDSSNGINHGDISINDVIEEENNPQDILSNVLDSASTFSSLLLQNTLALMTNDDDNITEGGEEESEEGERGGAGYKVAYEETIDELDMIR